MDDSEAWDSDGHARSFGMHRTLESLQNAKGYSDYMSYPPRDNQEIAQPTWELLKSDLQRLKRAYIIARDFTKEEMIKKVKNIMYPIVKQVLKGDGFCFSIPRKFVDDMKYHPNLCFPLLKRDKVVKRTFRSANTTHAAAMTAWAMKAVFENLNSDLVITQRDLFYRRSLLFQNQEASNRTIADICTLLECTRRSLNISSEDRGCVCGGMKLLLKDKGQLDCSQKINIPDVKNILSCTVDPDLKMILVVEKGTIFNYLERLDFHHTNNCIVMTSNGFPNISSRQFLKWLQQKTKLPVVGVSDADPAGLEIMITYSQGSVNLAQENFNLAVPSLRWVGISLSDIEELGMELNDYNSEVLKAKDVTKLENLLSEKYTKLTPRWRAAAEKMLAVNRKTSFEMVHENGYRFVADSVLPKLISRAMKDTPEPSGQE